MANKHMAVKHRMYILTNPDPLRSYTARALAKAAGCSPGTISDLRNGRVTEISQPLASGLAAALGVTMDSLFEPTGRMSWERPQ